MVSLKGINLKGILGKLGDKGKLIAAGACAVTAVTMAVVTFLSGGDGLADVSKAEDAKWNGPVNLLDPDYQHLVTVGKIARAQRDEEYVSVDAGDPMVAPSGAIKAKRPTGDGARKAPEPTTLPHMWLSGIIWDPETPIAMIDGVDLRVGDRIKGARVVEIRMDSVVLSYASKQYVLTVD